MNRENKKIIIKRNMIASFVGFICMCLVIYVAPLYQIFDDMQVKDVNLTMTEINKNYLYIVSFLLFLSFIIGFYASKAVFNIFLRKKENKIKENGSDISSNDMENKNK